MLKQIIISVALFALAMALIVGVIMPLTKHGSTIASSACTGGEAISTRLESVINSP